MSVLIVGSVALDSIETPWGKVSQVLGGSASYAALAARLWSRVHLVGVVGSDFPATYLKLFSKFGLNGSGFQQVRGKTFRWQGRYDHDLQAKTLALDLGVFEAFDPRLSPQLRDVPYAFLGNIHPSLQWRVLQQMNHPRITACDSREDWIRHNRKDLLRVIRNSGQGAPAGYRVAELTTELEQFLAGNFVVSVDVAGEQQEPVRRAVMEGLLREGLPAGERPVGHHDRLRPLRDEVGGRELHHLAHGFAESFQGIRERGFGKEADEGLFGRSEVRVEAVEECFVDFLLGGEVVVDVPKRNAGLFGDVS